jgi:tellurium resistance protein TerD
MGLSLSKGGNVSLTKTNPGLVRIKAGLGWDPRTTAGEAFDLDASALLLGANGKVRSNDDFIFYNQTKDVAGSVEYMGDNRTGEGDGDDEVITVDLSKVPADVDKIVFVVSIDEADVRGQNFGSVRDAFVRLVNADDDVEAVRYDLSEDASTETALNFAELYRNGAEWKFKAIGQGYNSGLKGVAEDFGVVGL